MALTLGHHGSSDPLGNRVSARHLLGGAKSAKTLDLDRLRRRLGMGGWPLAAFAAVPAFLATIQEVRHKAEICAIISKRQAPLRLRSPWLPPPFRMLMQMTGEVRSKLWR